MLQMTELATPIGALRLYADANTLIRLHRSTPEGPPGPTPPGGPAPAREPAVLTRACEQLREYFAGERRTFTIPVAPRGTAFQELVWRALAEIPYGETWSYGKLARAIGRPAASRAVGAANGKNPIALLVPCHRVIATSGALSGYAGGTDAKRWLLDHERGQRSMHAPSAHLG